MTLSDDDSYPGSKNGAGVWQRIISLMPEHDNYFELFLGKGAVMRRKRPAPLLNVGADIDAEVLTWWRRRPTSSELTLLQGDSLRILSSHPAMQDPRTLVYLDPPYLAETRTRLFYAYEFEDPAQHAELITIARGLRCMVMISGYWSPLYAAMLERWRVDSFRAMTRGGVRTEHVWMNFEAGRPLHDVRFVGQGFRERERIKRKRNRWVARFAAMPGAERQVIREALDVVDRPSPEPAVRSASPLLAMEAS